MGDEYECCVWNEARDRVYLRVREWQGSKPLVSFILARPFTSGIPATAPLFPEDPSVRRCAVIAKRWGYGGIRVAYLFSLRSTGSLDEHRDLVGPEANEILVREILNKPGQVIAAWGRAPLWTLGAGISRTQARVIEVVELAKAAGVELVCLGRNDDGSPRDLAAVKLWHPDPLAPWPGPNG